MRQDGAATPIEKYGPWAVVAGGSEGIAEHFARRLASSGFNLVLIARKPEPLEKLASDSRARNGIQVRPLQLDLTRPDLLDRVRESTDDVEVGLLIFNAGSTSGLSQFVDKTLDQALWPIRLSALCLTTLTHHFGLKMAKRGRGGLLFVGSLGGWMGMSNISTYCGAKAFVHVFTEALWTEMTPLGVDVLCYSVGLTETPSKQRSATVVPPGAFIADPDDVAKQALEDLTNGNGPIQVPEQERERVQTMFWLPRRKLLEIQGGYVKVKKPATEKV
jgi:short-subunit dehydrogenase